MSTASVKIEAANDASLEAAPENPLATEDEALSGAPAIDPASPQRFVNRELSWLAFNRRVIEEAQNRRHPLFERLRFLSISASNLDEFYMVRVAGLMGMVHAGRHHTLARMGFRLPSSLPGWTRPPAQLIADQQHIWAGLDRELRKEGVSMVTGEELQAQRPRFSGRQFNEQIFPVLTPLAIDPAHPFPFIPNLGFTIALSLTNQRDNKDLSALIPVPPQLKRFRAAARHRPEAGALHSAGACDRALFRQAVPRPRCFGLGHVPHSARQRRGSGGRSRGSGSAVRDHC